MNMATYTWQPRNGWKPEQEPEPMRPRLCIGEALSLGAIGCIALFVGLLALAMLL